MYTMIDSCKTGWTIYGLKTPDPDTVATVLRVKDLLNADKLSVTEARPTGIEMAAMIYGHLMRADDGDMIEALLEENNTEKPSEAVAAILEATGQPVSARVFAQTISLWHSYQSSMLGFFNDFDVLICPVNAHTAIPHEEQEDYLAYTYTFAYNLTGWPGLVIRAGTDDQGLPVGIQVLAAPFREDHCLAVGQWLEARLGDFNEPDL